MSVNFMLCSYDSSSLETLSQFLHNLLTYPTSLIVGESLQNENKCCMVIIKCLCCNIHDDFVAMYAIVFKKYCNPKLTAVAVTEFILLTCGME
jgi:hypothetical protein